jgi:uncharacterized repeat protein (TIGR03803 family)
MKHLTMRACTILCSALLAACGSNGSSSLPSLVPSAARSLAPVQSSVSGKLAASSENVLYRFKGGMDGSSPQAALTEVNGTLFGTTDGGGGSYCVLKSVQSGCGTIFSINTSGSEYTVVHRYPDTGTGGARPLTLTYSSGQFYGTTVVGGNLSCEFGGGCGTVFTMHPSGASYNVLYSFASLQDGQRPETALLDLKGTLYGTTSLGGSGKCYFTSGLVGCGTLYKVNVSSGKKRILYSFRAAKTATFLARMV